MKKSFRFDEVLDFLPAAHAGLLERVARAAGARGEALFLVGGPVRDLLLGRALRDLDLLVEGEAEPLAEAVVAANRGQGLAFESHARFGTLRLAAPDASVDLARTRRERYDRPGALPTVEPGGLDEDVRRRDFSINALVLPLDARERTRAFGVLDAVGGLDDLAAGRVRILHARSFHDDPTRALRAARLAVRLGFKLERGSRTALRDALRDGAFGGVSGERFRRELALVYDEASRGVDAGRILQLLSDWHVLAALEPGLAFPRDRQAPMRRFSRSLEQPEWPAAGRFRAWVTGFSIWLSALPAVTRRRTLERLAVRGEQATRILRFAVEGERMVRALARARGRGAVDALLAEQAEETVAAVFALADVATRRRITRWGVEDRRRRAPVVGSDLTALGLTGPDVGRGLARIRAAFLDGEIANREEALVLAQELARRAARTEAPRAKRTKATRRRASPARATRARAGEDVAPEQAILDTAPRPRQKARTRADRATHPSRGETARDDSDASPTVSRSEPRTDSPE